MKVLIVGRGSIASQHKKNIESFGHEAHFLKDTFCGEDNITESSVLDFFESTIDEYEAVIIANASNKHYQYSKIAILNDKKIYLEKPPCLLSDELNDLIDLCKKKNLDVPVGFQLRFSKGIIKLNEIIQEEKNNIISFDIHVGQDLNQWRKGGIDKSSYYANRKSGGGVIYELCHELDLALWMFGKPENYIYELANLSNKDMNIDDFFHSIWKYKNFIGVVHMDMINPVYRRYIEVTISNYKLIWNIENDSLIRIDSYGNKIIYENKLFQRQDLIQRSMSNFLSWVENGDIWLGSFLEESTLLLNFFEKVRNGK